MSKHFLIVANRSKAKFYTSNSTYTNITHAREIECPEGRAKNRELVTDKPGRESAGGASGQHTLDPSLTKVEKEAERFATEVAQEIEKLRVENILGKLTLVAEPTMLGLLRQKLSSNALDLVTESINKDLAQMTDDEIQKNISKAA